MKHWIQAFRLRTLPLALSSIVLGSLVAISKGSFNVQVFYLAVLTTVLLQILSNLANDLGDSIKGTDNENRIGPERAVQSGAISMASMKRAVVVTSVFAFAAGLALLFTAFEGLDLTSLAFLILGILAIAAALRYTMGKNPYGYRGLGDVFVFLFFGCVGVGGSFFLHSLYWSWDVLLPASSIGLFSAAVLNMNNMRDIENDAASGKITLVVRLGFERARIYHQFLLILGMACSWTYWFHNSTEVAGLIFSLSFIPFIHNLLKVRRVLSPKELEPELKRIALGTFFFSLIFGASLILLS
mgnify:FL=1